MNPIQYFFGGEEIMHRMRKLKIDFYNNPN